MISLFRSSGQGEVSDQSEPTGALVIESASGSAVPVSEPLGPETIRQLGTSDAIAAVEKARDRVGVA
jgi:hypothetical protein